jgi:hypothetical protein
MSVKAEAVAEVGTGSAPSYEPVEPRGFEPLTSAMVALVTIVPSTPLFSSG